MRIINQDVRARGHRGRRAIIIAAVAGVTAMALTASTSAASAPVRATTDNRIEATATDASATPPAAFIAVTPVRILDTRPAPAGPVGLATPAKLGPGARLDLRLAGDGLIVPASASGVLINITIDEDATLPSYLTVWPLGEPQPFTSANNAYPGLIQANSLVAKLANGGISIFNQRGSVNVVIDLVGYIVPLASLDLPGSQLQSGSGAPTTGVGDNGDFYLDTTNRILYGPKTNGAWPTPGINLGGSGAAGPSGVAGSTGPAGATGPAGPSGPIGAVGAVGAAGTAGAAGSQIYSGAGAPVTLHVNGDYFIDTTSGDLYKQTAGAWALATSLKGPAGGIAAALGAFNNAPSLAGALSFPTANDTTAGPVTTAITHTSGAADSFVLAAGSYRVSYRVGIGATVVGGGVQLSLTTGASTVSVGSTNNIAGLISLGAVASDTVLVNVPSSSTLKLALTGLVGVSLSSASIEIEKIA